MKQRLLRWLRRELWWQGETTLFGSIRNQIALIGFDV
jgi:hypothetical protein